MKEKEQLSNELHVLLRKLEEIELDMKHQELAKEKWR